MDAGGVQSARTGSGTSSPSILRLPKKRAVEIRVLKGLLFVYILLGLLIAGVNFGWAPNASEKARAVILAVWQIYENQFKTVLIIICSVLTLRLAKTRETPRMRRYNLIGLISAALVVHIAGPLVSGNPELYFVGMPLPWYTAGLRLAVRDSSFYQEHLVLWGEGGITSALIFFAAVHVVVLAGTLLLGRRWQCSTICMFNGFASEVFAPAFPLFGKRRKLGKGLLSFFAVMRWLLLGTSLILTVVWLGRKSRRPEDHYHQKQVHRLREVRYCVSPVHSHQGQSSGGQGRGRFSLRGMRSMRATRFPRTASPAILDNPPKVSCC
jgi:hypothetical protein